MALVWISLSLSGPKDDYFFAAMSSRTGFKKHHLMQWNGFPFVISSENGSGSAAQKFQLGSLVLDFEPW